MKRYFILTIIALALAGCQNGLRTEAYSDDIALAPYEGSADSLLMSISLEYLVSGVPAHVEEAINQAIVTRAFDLEGWEGNLEESASTYRENLIDEYLTENAGEQTVTWEDRMDGTFTGSFKNWINYVLTYFSYRGGAHGIQTVSPIVFDAGSGNIVSEEDLFADGYAQPIAAMLRDAVTASMQVDDEELLELVEMDSIVPNNNVSVGDSGIEWVFQPYEVGPYALGIVTATLSWKQLKPYLK